MLSIICFAQGTSLLDDTGTSEISVTSANDAPTLTLTEMTTTASLMNGTKFPVLLFENVLDLMMQFTILCISKYIFTNAINS